MEPAALNLLQKVQHRIPIVKMAFAWLKGVCQPSARNVPKLYAKLSRLFVLPSFLHLVMAMMDAVTKSIRVAELLHFENRTSRRRAC